MVNKLDLYRIFREVAKYQNFSKAAKELYMTQPAVSQAIMQLEKELNMRLFTRLPKGATLTNEGQLLFEYINSAINLIHAGEKKLFESKELMMGELKIGVGDTVSRYFLLPYLESFHNQFPNIQLKVVNRTTLELGDLLKSGEIDIAICNLPIEDSSIEARKWLEIQDVFVCGQKYQDKLSMPLDLVEIVNFPLILLESKSNSRRYVQRYMASKGVRILPEIELGSHDLLLEFARFNLGIACVVKEFSQDYLERGLLHEVELIEPIPKRAVGLCFLKGVSLTPAATKLVEIVEGR